MSAQKIVTSGNSATLADSCVDCQLQIDQSLLQQLAETATFMFQQLQEAPAAGPAIITIAASQDGSKTIKPTLTFQEGAQGMEAIVILQVEAASHAKDKK